MTIKRQNRAQVLQNFYRGINNILCRISLIGSCDLRTPMAARVINALTFIDLVTTLLNSNDDNVNSNNNNDEFNGTCR